MSQLLYRSTRGEREEVLASQAIVQGLAKDGGLFVPRDIPRIDKDFIELSSYNYRQLAQYIMGKYLTDFKDEELKYCIDNAYNNKFESSDITPIVKKGEVYFLELYHGPTLAFKDMALSILPYLLKISINKTNTKKEIVILTATSGDTGKAALEGFADVEGVKIIVFFPEEGVSEIQKRQMITQKGKNTLVVAIKGNFDDAQSGVKETFNNREFNDLIREWGYTLSSANSINIGRLIPQIVYYINSYVRLLKEKEISKNEYINICVPTGNFGNILAAHYAKKMGLPIKKLICASNVNNVLYDFLRTGIYDRRRDFKKTISPSMDILISSNLERLLFELSNQDDTLIKNLMNNLNEKGYYEITNDMKEGLKEFYGGYATDDEAKISINKVYKKFDYLIDPHTAVAYHVYEQYKMSTGDNTKTIIASTASPYKFTRSVVEAITPGDIDESDDFKLINELSRKTKTNIPQGIKDIEKKEIIHSNLCSKEEIMNVITKFLEK